MDPSPIRQDSGTLIGMLSIGELASHVGVTVRTVRHYHQRGLLPEPPRDASGYRRYGPQAVVDLVRIRTLADAGVPLARVHELLRANADEFATAVTEIDRLHAHRERIARLATDPHPALPQEVVAYLDRLAEMGVDQRIIDGEKDGWTLIAAKMPDLIPTLMADKHAQLDDPRMQRFYRRIHEAIDWDSDDPRVVELVDDLVAIIEEHADEIDHFNDHYDPQLVALLDTMFLESVPIARRILELQAERGWRGWTKLERVDPPAR